LHLHKVLTWSNKVSPRTFQMALLYLPRPPLSLLSNYNIKTIHIPARKNIHLLRPVKDKLGLKVAGIYCIPCECGKVYVGQTGQTIKARHKEHMRCLTQATGKVSSGRALNRHSTSYPLQQYLQTKDSNKIHGLSCEGSHQDLATS